MYRLLSDLFFGQGFGAVFGEFLECRGYTIAIYEIVFLNKVLEELTFVSKRRRNSGGILYILVLFLVSYPTYAWIKQFYFNPCSDCVYSDKCYPYLSFLHFYRNRGGSLIDRSYLQKKNSSSSSHRKLKPRNEVES